MVVEVLVRRGHPAWFVRPGLARIAVCNERDGRQRLPGSCPVRSIAVGLRFSLISLLLGSFQMH